MRVLLIEPDLAGGRRLQAALEGNGYAVEYHAEPLLGRARARAAPFDLLVVAAGGTDGDAGLASLRAGGLTVPILAIVDDLGGQIRALDDGADDGVTRPLCLRELLARLRALGRIRRDAWAW